jgi:hypothetical protein
VREALAALPGYWHTETHIAGIKATDVHTLASALGASIEEQVVATLNTMREAWDPTGAFRLFHFMRQAQTFPDVILARTNDAGAVVERLLGVELKGWFILAKEGEPNLRFLASRDACNPWDLVAVVPWCLSQVISGRPIVFAPWIESARYAADYRNWWWQHVRNVRAQTDRGIDLASHVSPYPAKSDEIDDKPRSDKGKNFGRLARTGIMDQYKAEMAAMVICGIKASHWVEFFEAFGDNATDVEIRRKLESLGRQIAADAPSPQGEAIHTILEGLEDLLLLQDG